ncbi:unnamed protein product [Cuscuta campestris]|uniref:Ubiquitin carboxyl-terminal hydrolase n=1 Tax=Cuscuta campestris TaxID=132261 RepID=A0A484KIL4_9ASTE|nr:unnamed protein product [Cuscuta campestris]
MGKKAKKKARSGHNEKQVHVSSPMHVSHQSKSISNFQKGGVAVVEEEKTCPHVDKKLNLEKVSAKVGSSESIRCEECMGEGVDNQSSKGKTKHTKKKVSTDKAIWVCLECGRFSCGGVGLPTTPQSHAVRHSKKYRHSLAVQYENSNLIWCFPCNKLIPCNKTYDSAEHKKVIHDIVNLIKGTQPEVKNVCVDNVFSSSGSGSIRSYVISKQSALVGLDGKSGYSVRGFINLGNTCFFNSVMQNLMTISKLREQFIGMDGFPGPLTAAMKKLFMETHPETGLRGAVVNPKSVYSSICSKFPQFRGYQQQDSHELLRCLLDGLCTEELAGSGRTKNASKEDPTLISSIFGGQLSSTVSCLECGHSSVVYEPFLDLSLPVPTKRPPSKKSQIVTRPKKSKLPPKKSGRISTRASKYIISQPAQSAPESAMVSLRDASLDSLDVSTLADDMGLFSSATQGSGNDTMIEAGTLNHTDESTWLDYIEPETLPTYEVSPLHSDEYSNNKYFGDGSFVQHDVSLQQNSETDLEIASPYRDVTSSSDNLASSNNLEQNEVLCATQAHDMEINPSSTTHCEDDIPLQVHDSKVIFLPYKEESTSSFEVPKGESEVLSVAGCEQDVDLDCFGGLFDEPEETTAGCSVKPSSNSDSDPDEVDNSNSTVSVESCLAYFTKPENLTISDHAWKCENCSKVLLEQKKRERVADGYGDMLDGELNDHRYNDNDTCSSSSEQFDRSHSTEIMEGNHSISQKSKPDGTVDAETDSETVKVERDATKRILIDKPPRVLTIHLKRFNQDARGRLSKLNGHVYFKDTLDLKPYIHPRHPECGTHKYQLLGVVEHSGTMRGGHYVAYVRGGRSGESVWYYASDAHVSQVSLEQVLRSEAYILFYEEM